MRRRNTAEGHEKADQQRRGAKTEAIRMAMAEHPDWGAKQIYEELERRGIRASIQLVYKVMEAVESLKAATGEPVSIEALNLQELMEFKVRVVDKYGGLSRIEALVRALKKLQCPAESEAQDDQGED